MKKFIPIILIAFAFLLAFLLGDNDIKFDYCISNSVQILNTCDDVQDALNNVYVAYSAVEAGSLPSPANLDSFLDWPLLFNEKLKENFAYNDIISSVSQFDELIENKPDCLDDLE